MKRCATAQALACQSGVVYVETLVAFLPVLLLFLCVVQLTLLGTAHLVVQHAAWAGARVAAVVIDDDPADYDCAERGVLLLEGEEPAGQPSHGLLNRLARGAGAMLSKVSSKGGPRTRAIRSAVHVPLAAVAPPTARLLGMVGGGEERMPSLSGSALGEPGLVRFGLGHVLFARVASAVTFPATPDAEVNPAETEIKPGDSITVRVTLLSPCEVPVARFVLCRSWLGIAELEQIPDDFMQGAQQASGGNFSGLRAAVEHVEKVWDQDGRVNPEMKELGMAEMSWLQWAFALDSSLRFSVLRGQATLPVQAASYRYESEGEDGICGET